MSAFGHSRRERVKHYLKVLHLAMQTSLLCTYNIHQHYSSKSNFFKRWNIWRAGASEAVLKITDELQISYLEKKSESIHDEILLMIHGFTGCKENYCELIRLFPKNFHIILIDLPGHGETIPNDVNGDYTITNQVENLHKVSLCCI